MEGVRLLDRVKGTIAAWGVEDAASPEAEEPSGRPGMPTQGRTAGSGADGGEGSGGGAIEEEEARLYATDNFSPPPQPRPTYGIRLV